MEDFFLMYFQTCNPKDVISYNSKFGLWDHFSVQFIGEDDKYYSLSVLCTKDKIIGDPNTFISPTTAPRLESSSAFQEQEGLFKMFSRYLRVYDTFEEFKEKSVDQKVTPQLMNFIHTKYGSEICSIVDRVMVGPFSIIRSQVDDRFVYVTYKVFERVELPLKFYLGDMTPMKERNYGKYTPDFRKFVEEISGQTGGVIFYGSNSSTADKRQAY